jgi:hypothetical protein
LSVISLNCRHLASARSEWFASGDKDKNIPRFVADPDVNFDGRGCFLPNVMSY